MNDNISILLVDDHAMLRKGMALLLGGEADMDVAGEAGDGEQAIAQAQALQPDVVVMDINMPGVNGIEATRRIVSEFPDIKIIALSIHSGKRFVDDMLSAGAAGYLLKESVPEELPQGIRAVMRGEMYLSSAITSTVVGAYVEGMPDAEADQSLQVDIGILQTKLYRPAAPLDLVTRIRLLERLTARRKRPLTLVSAPAGYGKSILVSNWLESIDWPGAWLSLDESDADLRQFLSYFVAEVQSLFAHACEVTLSLVGAPQLPSVRALVSGHLEAAIPAAQHFTRVSKKSGLVKTQGSSHYLRANAELHSYHLDEALQGFQYAANIRDIMHRKLAIDAQVGLVLTHQAMQRSDDAVGAMRQLLEFALDTDEPEHFAVAQSCQARLSLLQNDSKPAIDWARSYDVAAHVPSMLMWLEIPVITQLRVIVATGCRESLQRACELLAELRQSTDAMRNTYQSIEPSSWPFSRWRWKSWDAPTSLWTFCSRQSRWGNPADGSGLLSSWANRWPDCSGASVSAKVSLGICI
jgi:DNA-binding NarL/FixJ family response regulator